MLETKDLYLRALSLDDLEDFYDYASHPKVGAMSLWQPHQTRQESRLILEEFVASQEFFAIYHKLDKKMIGVVALHFDEIRQLDRSICREIGYGLNYHYWSQGYMTQAASLALEFGFEYLNLDLITGYTSESNLGSQRVMEKIGMDREGLLRMAWRNYKDQVQSKCCYSILKDKYYLNKEKASLDL